MIILKKNNMGFFLAETIVMIALVTTVMAFVFPNVSKIYDNYKNQIKYYDQTEDIYVLKAVYENLKNYNAGVTNPTCKYSSDELDEMTNITTGCLKKLAYNGKTGTKKELWWRANGLSGLYIAPYMGTPGNSMLSFDKYLKRMKKTTYDENAYRLIGVFDTLNEDGSVKSHRYASIKIQKAW